MPDATSHLEIERKYLLRGMPRLPDGAVRLEIEQGYIDPGAGVTVDGGPTTGRLRRTVHPDGEVRCQHTVKTGSGLVRTETERDLTIETFEQAWPGTAGARLRKTRFCVADGDLEWVVDVFRGLDLFLAEVELPTEDTAAEPPVWLAAVIEREVTGDPAYGNFQMARRLGGAAKVRRKADS